MDISIENLHPYAVAAIARWHDDENTLRQIYTEYASSDEQKIFDALTKNIHTPSDLLLTIYKDSNCYVSEIVRHINVTGGVIKEVFNNAKSEEDVRDLATFANTIPVSIQMSMVKNYKSTHISLAQNAKTDRAVLEWLSDIDNHGDRGVLIAVLRNDSASSDLLHWFVLDLPALSYESSSNYELSAASMVSNNKNTRNDTLRLLLDKIESALTQPKKGETIILIASNIAGHRNADPDMQDALMRKSGYDGKILSAVKENPLEGISYVARKKLEEKHEKDS